MNAKQLKRIFSHAMYCMAIAAMVISVTGSVSASDSTPSIRVSTSNNYLQADDFAPNSLVTFTIYESQYSSEKVLEINRQADVSGHVFIDGWEHDADFVAGNNVVATDDTGNEKQLVLEPLTIEVFNPSTDYVAGTASPGRDIWVVVGNNDVGYPAEMGVTANTDDVWQADFDYDFNAEMWASALVSDDDWDVTVYHLGPTPAPWIIAFPENDAVEAWEWPEGATVYLTIDNAPEGFMREEVAEVTSWGDPRTYIRFDFAGEDGYDLQVGDMVTLTDQFGQSTTHTVRNLAITNIVQADDTIKGTADPGAEVYAWPHATGEPQLAIAKTTGAVKGKWNVDFSGIFDLTPGECGRSEIRDELANSTAVDWCVPSTRFTVWPEWNYLEGYEWPARDEVSISVSGKESCSTEATPAFPDWDPLNTFFSVNFPEGCSLAARDLITLSSETFSSTHQIQELTITEVDIRDNTLTGTAAFDPEQYLLHTWIHEVDESYMQMSAEGGTWLADFGSQGFDLQPGMGGRVELVDQASNATAVDWHIPLPTFAAYMPSAIEGYDWPMGHEISLTINDNEYPENAYSEQRPDFPEGETRVLFEIWRYDVSLEVNDHVVMTDLETGFSKELWVADLQVTEFNLSDKTVSGIYDPDRSFWTQLEGQDPNEIVFEGNTWMAAFADMSPGSWGYIAQDDDDHDGTVWDYQVPDIQVVIANQPDWVNSGIYVSTGQSFRIEALGFMNPCSDNNPDGAEYCIFYTPQGLEGEVPYENEFGIFPGPGLGFMALLGQIDGGEPFFVGAGDTFTAEETGWLWFTPNDNLRMDNQGAYWVSVWLGP